LCLIEQKNTFLSFRPSAQTAQGWGRKSSCPNLGALATVRTSKVMVSVAVIRANAHAPAAAKNPKACMLGTTWSCASSCACSTNEGRSASHGDTCSLTTESPMSVRDDARISHTHGTFSSASSSTNENITCIKGSTCPGPCAFFHAVAGCTNGSLCKFCHCCDAGNFKRQCKAKHGWSAKRKAKKNARNTK
jgi:hypothetical protein